MIDASSRLKPVSHLCAFIKPEEERDATIADFICRSIRAERKVLCILDTYSAGEIARLLRDQNLDMEFLVATGRLIIRRSSESRQKTSVPDSLLHSIDEERKQSREEGYSGMAVLVEMKGGRGNLSRKDRLQLESRLQEFASAGDMVLCLYNRNQFSESALVDALERHPFVFLDKSEKQNPYFAHPEGATGALQARLIGITGAGPEITVRHTMEEALRESEERYALAARGSNDGLWDWNLKTGSVYCSPRWKSMLGLTEIGNTIEDWYQRIHPEDVERVRSEVASHLRRVTPHFQSEHRMRHADGNYRWILTRGMAVLDSEGNACRMAGSQTDITQQKKTEEQLLHDALHDTLTGLPNRPLFMDRLGAVINRAKRRSPYLFAVLFLDLDRFKLINDSLGHMTGDEVLIEVARRVQSSLRPGDTVARLGGDEFAVLLDDIKDIADALGISKRIQEYVSEKYTIDGQEIYTAASIGIAVNLREYKKPEDMLRDADTAMYRAKAYGKNRHELFETNMHQESVAQLHLENDLRRAIDRHEFEMYYQPIVSLQDGSLTGFEALIRWQHPTRGLLLPKEFIGILEQTGLIEVVGEWALQQSCAQLQFWNRAEAAAQNLTMSVNLSMKQFPNPGIVSLVDRILKETGLEPARLILEITETMIMENPEQTIVTLTRLGALGVCLHIDDFGTGYSSLSYLIRFPLDALKMDQTFVKTINESAKNFEVARTIVALAHNLSLEIIAEGVETQFQMEQLRLLGCEYAQGFHFSPPVDAKKAGEFIRAAGNRLQIVRAG